MARCHSRRDFMKDSSLALVGAMALPRGAIAVNTAPKKVRIGVVGGDDDPILKDNAYDNPFWNESAMFRTNQGNAFRVNIWWKGAHRGCERAQGIGNQISFYAPHPNGLGPVIIRSAERMETDDAGFVRKAPKFERYKQPEWWKTDRLPEPLRHNSGHEGSHTFLTHEFIDALVHNRWPAIDVYESLAYTVPGIVAHESALKEGELKKIPQYNRT